MLTPKLHKLLLFIDGYISRTGGVSPSFDEMRDACGIKHKSGVHRMLGGLEDRGFITRLHDKWRAIKVIRLPDGPAVNTARKPDTVIPSVGKAPKSLTRVTLRGVRLK